MGALVKIEKNKKSLVSALEDNKKLLIDRLPDESQQQAFKENFLELAENDFLIEKVEPKHILTFALNVSKLGININPIYKEAYILPFNVKDKGMMPTLVMPKNGIRQIAYDAGFFLEIDRVYSFESGGTIAQSEMSQDQLSLLKTTDGAWVDKHFDGFNITLTDLIESEKKLPVQTAYVGSEYVKKVTKQLQSQDYKIQTWEHKACRRAFEEFFIPRERRSTVLMEVDKLNDSQEIIDTEETTPANDVDVKKTLLEDDAIEGELVVDEFVCDVEIVTEKTIIDYYDKNIKTDRGQLLKAEIMKQKDWRKYDQEKLSKLYQTLKDL